MGKPRVLPAHLHRAAARITLLLFSVVPGAAAQTVTSALAVPLLLPSAIVFDSAGNLYLAETANHVIRKVDTTGVITTIAGTGAEGFSGDDGPATAATLDSPQGLALDSANNLYLADTHNHRIRRLALATGVITSIAGTGAQGFSGDSGPAIAAQLSLPTALAVDASNNLYFADTGNHRIRRIDAITGILTTVAGDGTQGFSGDNGAATSASIDSPSGLAISPSSLYLADTHNHRIRKIALTSGIITTLTGNGALGFSGDTSLASSAAVALPRGLAIDSSGNLYLADTANHRIRRIDAATGIISTVVGSGTQAFSGDGGPATSATLNSPSAVAIPPSELLTLSDTANQRVRQLDAASASGPEIRTIAGLGTTVPGVLTLNAPSVIAYGSGQVLAELSTSSPATGNVAFLNTADSSTLGIPPLVSNVAALSTGTLPAGSYSLTAIYSGDQNHLSAESSALTFRIAPLTLTVSIADLSLSYAQPIPALSGTLIGVLPQDASKVTASFHTAASVLSSPGAYPITVSLAGPAAGNYTVAATTASVVILPVSTSTSFSTLLASAAAGSALNLTVDVAGTAVSSASKGPFTGTVTLLDSGSPLGTVPVSFTGIASFPNISLPAGVHTLTAVYSGSANFSASTSAPQQIIVTSDNNPTPGPNPAPNPTPTPAPSPAPSADFTLAATGATSQTILSGTAANFTFTIQPQGSTSSPVTLAASGLPNLATASFNPPTVPPSATANSFTLTIATPQTVARNRSMPPLWAMIFLPFLGLAILPQRRGLPAKLLTVTLLGIALLPATGCGNRVNTASAAAIAASQSYTIIVTGTATTAAGALLQHSTNVTLVIQPAS